MRLHERMSRLLGIYMYSFSTAGTLHNSYMQSSLTLVLNRLLMKHLSGLANTRALFL